MNWNSDDSMESWRDDFPSAKRCNSPKFVERRNRFYESRAWIRLRGQVLRAYGRECMRCGRKDGVIQVDHIRPRVNYPDLALDFNNMQVLCLVCNQNKGLKILDYRKNPIYK